MKHLQIKTVKKTSEVPLYKQEFGLEAETIPAYFTHKVSEGNNYAGLLSNPKLYKGRTYYVKVLFRTRGDGNSTPNKCSSVGFIAYWDDWHKSRSYIHYSDKAYSERGHFVSWTYSFTVSEDIQPTGTAIYFIINNGWASGCDNQTIDLYYVKYWDSTDQVYNEIGTDYDILEFKDKKTNDLYFTPMLEVDNDNIISVKGKYYPTAMDYFEGLKYSLPGALTMSPGNFSTSAGQMKVWKSDGLYKLTFTIKDNYTSSETSCHYYKTHEERYGWFNQYTRTVVDFDFWQTYNNSADSNIYIYKNGKLLNSNNYDLDGGGTFTIYVKPNDIVAIKHVYRGNGIIVTLTNSVFDEQTVKNYISNGNTAYGYIKETGDETYSATEGFGKGKANSSTITFTKTKPKGLGETLSFLSKANKT